ncbi:hypothetical protein FRC00_008546 [Tulasnella sp. 408]|nr:hypothetical protein FRC00_008546 [Tulasnella sp. 408]
MPPKLAPPQGSVKRALPPNQRKRRKPREELGTLTIELLPGAASGAGPSGTALPRNPQLLPVVIAPDNEWQRNRLEDDVPDKEDSPELDFTQPPEPDHFVSELLALFLNDNGAQSIEDDVAHSVLEEVERQQGSGLPDDEPLATETPANDDDISEAPDYLRSGYLNEMYASDFLPPSSICAGRICRALAALQSDNDAVPSENPPAATAEFRCRDCIGQRVYCQNCIVSIHDTMPFHRVEKWNGEFFVPQSPAEAQVHQLLDLGHNGSRCDAPYSAEHLKRPATGTLTVLHINGYHKLQVRYCCCLGSPEPYQQLLQAGLFPATHTRPQTAFTFQLLKHFERFNLASKTAAHDYHKALLHLTDNVLPQSIPSSYHAFVDVIRQWRVLMMLRHAGKQGSKDLQAGELALRCPACPRPGINLPEGWEDHPQRRLLYGQFVSGDGNFHLVRRRNHAGTGKDAVAALMRKASMIGDGAFWVPKSTFESYLKASVEHSEARSSTECNTLAGSPLKGGSHFSGKNEVTGVFAVSCRHVCFCPSGVCDFSKGEGYRYVDVPMTQVIQAAINAGLKDLVISYDIACKYSINFLDRGVGRMSGELVETIWSYFDFLKYQTREMGPGSRQEMLSRAMNYWNWQKMVKMSDATCAALLRANIQCEHATQRLKGIEDNLGPEVVRKLESASAQAGSDKYMPSKSKIQCQSWISLLISWGTDVVDADPSRKEVLAALRSDEEATPSNPCGSSGSTHPTAQCPLRSTLSQQPNVVPRPGPQPMASPPAPGCQQDAFGTTGPESSPLAHRSRRSRWESSSEPPEDGSEPRNHEWVYSGDEQSSVDPDSDTNARRKKRKVGARLPNTGPAIAEPALAAPQNGPSPEMQLARLAWLDAGLTLETTQAKYIQLLKSHSKILLPGLKSSLQEKIVKHKARLEAGLKSHYEFLRSQGLSLPLSQLTPKEVHKDPILLPSQLSPAQQQQFGMVKLAQQEERLRIGLAFDALLKLRKALGVRSWLTRHARKTSGYSVNTRTQETFKRAEMSVQQWAKAYQRSWDALMKLGAQEPALHGLQPLQPGDLLLLSTWLEEERYRNQDSTLPWIWAVAPLPQQDVNVTAAIQDWGDEGLHFIKRVKL